jgi:hypothetical protein
MHDFCFSNGTIQYFSQPLTAFRGMIAAHDHRIPYAGHLGLVTSFLAIYPNHPIIPVTVMFVSAAPVQAWQHLSMLSFLYGH